MTTARDLLDDDMVLDAVRTAATRVARRYRRFITMDDLMQSGYLWVAQHPKKVGELVPDAGEPDKVQRQAFGRLTRLLERALEGVARTEKAARSGYHPDDEAFYSPALVEELLPTVFQADTLWNQPQGEPQEVRSTADPAESGNWPVMVLDIRQAWEKADLTPDERSCLVLRYSGGLTIDMLAAAQHASKETIIKRLRYGLAAVGRALHGVRPLTEKDQLPELTY